MDSKKNWQEKAQAVFSMIAFIFALTGLIVLFLISGCERIKTGSKFYTADIRAREVNSRELTTVARCDMQFTGIAISKKNRIFVNFPKWSKNVPISVAEIIDGELIPYPTRKMNERENEVSFKAVQSVYIDAKNRLWVLDTNNPQFTGVKPPGPILYQIDLDTNKIEHTYMFPPATYNIFSYFNDVRIDCMRNFAYITDSGSGALIVLNLTTATSRRVLADTTPVESEKPYLDTTHGRWKNTVDSDGIALTADGKMLYFAALTGHTLYRIETKYLRNFKLSDDQLLANVKTVAKIPATDGMLMDPWGNLFMGGLEDDSINLIAREQMLIRYFKDPRIQWADSFTRDSKGNIYFTTSQIHTPAKKRGDYRIMKFNPYKIHWLTREKIRKK